MPVNCLLGIKICKRKSACLLNQEVEMFYKNILNMIALVFFLISTGAVFAVEPTTFPTNKTSPYQRSNNVGVLVEPTALERSDPRSRKIPGKRGNTRGVLVEPTALERGDPRSRRIPGKRDNTRGVLVEPTALERSDPRSRKTPGKRGNTRGVLVEPTALERVTPKSRGNKFSGAKRKASSHRTSGSKKDAKRKKTR